MPKQQFFYLVDADKKYKSFERAVFNAFKLSLQLHLPIFVVEYHPHSPTSTQAISIDAQRAK